MESEPYQLAARSFFGGVKFCSAQAGPFGSLASGDRLVRRHESSHSLEQQMGENFWIKVEFLAPRFSAGVLLYEMLTGRPPFAAQSLLVSKPTIWQRWGSLKGRAWGHFLPGPSASFRRSFKEQKTAFRC